MRRYRGLETSCPRLRTDSSLNGAERLVGMGFRCWISCYQTCDNRYWENGWNLFAVAQLMLPGLVLHSAASVDSSTRKSLSLSS